MRNLTLKIACVILAIVVWIRVAATTSVEADVRLPMEITNLAETWTVAGNSLPEEARVRLRTPKLALLANDYLGVSLGRVRIDLANYEPGSSFLYVIKESDVQTEAEVVTLLPPVRLPLRIDWQERRHLPVEVVLSGQLNADWMLTGDVTARPDSVWVTGPRRFFRGLENIQTETLDLGPVQETLSRELSLVLPPEPLRMERSTVSVTMPVSRIEEEVVANVPVLLAGRAATPQVWISPPACDVMVRGPADSVAALAPSQLQVTVAVDSLGIGVHQVTGRIDHPSWVINVWVEPESFMVIVEEEPRPAEGEG